MAFGAPDMPNPMPLDKTTNRGFYYMVHCSACDRAEGEANTARESIDYALRIYGWTRDVRGWLLCSECADALREDYPWPGM
jgi:hypothetical protein